MLIGMNRDERIMDTPGFADMVTKDIRDALEAGDKSLEDNWKNEESTPCGPCKGSGYDLEDRMSCIACDGTGVDFTMVYGVEEGVAYARIIQNGMEALLEYCKARRESETKDWLKDDNFGLAAFAIPNSARIELIAQGYPVDDWEAEGDMRSYARAVQKHFPLFMLTNVVI